MPDCIDVPVVIVGGGSCGLNLSIFLSDMGVDHVLFERHPGTSTLPKAHIINQRTLEIFRQHGIAKEILAQGTPPRQMSQVVWQTSLAGDGPLDRKVLGRVTTWGCATGSAQNATYQQDAPYLPTNLPLLRSEPIFRSIAEERNPGKLLFNHIVTGFEELGDHVQVSVLSGDGRQSTYRAQYLVGADGGKTVGPLLGIELEGMRNLRNIVSVHFKADLSQYWDDRTGIAHFADPEKGLGMQSGSMLPLGPTWGRYSEEWQMHFAIKVEDPAVPKEQAVQRVRELLKLPELALEVLSFSNWILERVLAPSYQKGRVFIGGDAAHRHPPTTGLGLNTAVQDAHNLAWKLACVLKEKAAPALLDTYEQERLPIGRRNCDWAMFTSRCHQIIGVAIGLQDGKPELNRARLTQMFDETSEIGRATHEQLQYVIEGQSVEFHAHDMDLGFSYPAGAFVTDYSSPPATDYRRQQYIPVTRPGHRLPHAWLDFKGELVSTHDLLGSSGGFLLITDRDGATWISAAQSAAERRGVRLVVAQITEPLSGTLQNEYVDVDLAWSKVKGFGKGGAILVRPDGIVGWRASQLGNVQDIEAAFDKILGFSKATTNGAFLVAS